MKTLFARALALLFLLAAMVIHAQMPQIINYQGRVVVGGVNFDGTTAGHPGQFRFALVDGTGSNAYWSNDGSITGPITAVSQPANPVSLTVTKGLYSVLLGDTTLTNMTAIPNSVFANSDVRLRVWFNDGINGVQLLTPDQRIAAVGYAMIAAGVPDGAVTSSMLADGAVGSSQLAANAVQSGNLAAGAVGSIQLATGLTLVGTTTFSGDITLPATNGTGTAGVITQGGSPLIHTFGLSNLFAGTGAGNFTMTGGYNTAGGYMALHANAGGLFNTANGYLALSSNTGGYSNTATGAGALSSNTSGSTNTGASDDALFSNTTGHDNTAIGYASLYSNQTGSYNNASGVGALYSNTGDNNTATGYYALFSNTSGTDNTAIGNNALFSNTDATRNVALGVGALYSQSFSNGGSAWESDNVAVGYNALFANQPTSNRNGNGNTAVGSYALSTNTYGSSNTAVGTTALRNNTIGSNNTAFGYNALLFNTGGGNGNTAVGAGALLAAGIANGDIAIGANAGANIVKNFNIDIGNSGNNFDDHTIRIGDTQTATYIAGIAGATTGSAGGIAPVYIDNSGQLGVFTSSRRYKEHIQSMGDASNVILSLKPVTFRYKPEFDKSGTPEFGLIAEEVEKQCPDLVVQDAKGEIYTVRYDAVNAMLLNEFLKEHERVETLGKRLAELEAKEKEREAREKAREERLAKLERLLPITQPMQVSTASLKKGDAQ